MLLVLDSTSRTLRAKMADAPSSVQCSVTVTYADTTASTFVEGMYPIQLNGTSFVTILPAPASGTRRVVKSVMFFNDDTMTHTITLYLTDNITDYPITKITLPAGASWASDDQTGVNVGGAVTDGSKGDINVSSGGATWTIADDAVTLAKLAEMASDKLIGRDTASTGNPEYIGVTGGIEFDGAGNIRTTSFSGDVSKAAGGTVLTLTDASVTTAKLADTAVTTAKLADASVTPAKLSTTAQALSFRNFLINGDMGIRQRETSVTGIQSSGYYTVDRWNTLIAGTVGTWTQTSENDGPSGQGFPRSLKMTCTTSNASLGSTDQLVIQQRLEGQNVQGILKGTANAQQVTVSFWGSSGPASCGGRRPPRHRQRASPWTEESTRPWRAWAPQAGRGRRWPSFPKQARPAGAPGRTRVLAARRDWPAREGRSPGQRAGCGQPADSGSASICRRSRSACSRGRRGRPRRGRTCSRRG